MFHHIAGRFCKTGEKAPCQFVKTGDVSPRKIIRSPLGFIDEKRQKQIRDKDDPEYNQIHRYITFRLHGHTSIVIIFLRI